MTTTSPEEVAMSIVTVFRARVNEDIRPEYTETAKRMVELVQTIPGFISYKKFTHEDGEQVTIVEFEDEESQQVWALQEEHQQARANGRESWFTEFDIAVCEVKRRYLKP